jgi:hydroxymethylglutaryl-CoA reductase
MNNLIEGFSSLNRREKIRIASAYASKPVEFIRCIEAHWNQEDQMTNRYADFSENAISNYYLPYSVVPNFLINGKGYMVPMVTEESSVVAAAAAGAKFWNRHGGFVTRVNDMLKPGHIHFIWKGSHETIQAFIGEITPALFSAVKNIEQSMRLRGGGIKSIRLHDDIEKIPGYYRIEVLFDTVDAMGANFINSCLETMAACLQQKAEAAGLSDSLDIIMSILSNYTPSCTVQCTVNCAVSELKQAGLSGDVFAQRFETAVMIAKQNIDRAVTHNKGIYNGIDAVLIATGNDFRATEAAGHAWASKDGRYMGLSSVSINDSTFDFTFTIPLSLGVVGGVTNLHPLAGMSLDLLGNPGAAELMAVVASAGMANHYSAIRSLICGGIQPGHMKLHLSNIANRLGASQSEKDVIKQHFTNRPVTHDKVKDFLLNHRKNQGYI